MRKRIEKLLEKFQAKIQIINDYNQMLEDDYKYYTGYGRSCPQFAFNVKLHGAYFPTDCVEDYAKSLNLSEQDTALLLEEFSDSRLDGVYEHFIDQERDWVKDQGNLNEWFPDIHILKREVNFYGRSGGWLCLGDLPLLEIDDTEVGNYPIWEWSNTYGFFIKWDSPTIIDDLKDYHRVTNLKDLFTELKRDLNDGDFAHYADKAIKRTAQIRAFDAVIEEVKKDAKKNLLDFLHDEIDTFLADNLSIDAIIQSAEAGDFSRIDNVNHITDTELVTNRHAHVPIDAAQRMIEAIVAGHDITGKHIGSYVVNKVIAGINDTYVKVGCHVFALKKTIEQINTFKYLQGQA
jgi:hypothetical protein